MLSQLIIRPRQQGREVEVADTSVGCRREVGGVPVALLGRQRGICTAGRVAAAVHLVVGQTPGNLPEGRVGLACSALISAIVAFGIHGRTWI